MRIHTQNTVKFPSLLILTYIIYQHAQTVVTTFIKLFTIYDIMINWKPDSTIKNSKWENFVQPSEVDHWSNVHPRALVHRTIIPHCHNATLLAEFPPKIHNPTNRSLFVLLPSDSLVTINNWLLGLE